MTIVHVNVNSYHDFSRLKYAQICWLVVSTPLKNMKVSWDDYSQYMGKNDPNHQPGMFMGMMLHQLIHQHLFMMRS
jgi:hypothetical protein